MKKSPSTSAFHSWNASTFSCRWRNRASLLRRSRRLAGHPIPFTRVTFFLFFVFVFFLSFVFAWFVNFYKRNCLSFSLIILYSSTSLSSETTLEEKRSFVPGWKWRILSKNMKNVQYSSSLHFDLFRSLYFWCFRSIFRASIIQFYCIHLYEQICSQFDIWVIRTFEYF